MLASLICSHRLHTKSLRTHSSPPKGVELLKQRCIAFEYVRIKVSVVWAIYLITAGRLAPENGCTRWLPSVEKISSKNIFSGIDGGGVCPLWWVLFAWQMWGQWGVDAFISQRQMGISVGRNISSTLCELPFTATRCQMCNTMADRLLRHFLESEFAWGFDGARKRQTI